MLRNSYTFCWMTVCKKLRWPIFSYTNIKQTQNCCYGKSKGGSWKKFKLVMYSRAKKTKGNRKLLKQVRACSHLPNAPTTRSDWRRSLACAKKKPHDLVRGGIWNVPSLSSFACLLHSLFLRTKGACSLFSFYFFIFFLSFPIRFSLIPRKNKTTVILFYSLKRQSILSISDDIIFSNIT